MGTRISVSSTVINLAGEETNRQNYLKNSVLGGVMSSKNISMGEHIAKCYISGPGTVFRNFNSWSNSDRPNNYTDIIEYKSSTVGLDGNNDFTQIAAQIPTTGNKTAEVISAEIDQGLYGYWADQRVYENHPTLVGTSYSVDYDKTTNTITLTFASGVVDSFVATGFDQTKTYLYVKYRTKSVSGLSNLNLYPATDVLAFPSMTGWTLTSDTSNTVAVTINVTNQTISSFSDSRPNVVGAIIASTLSGGYITFEKNYEKEITTVAVGSVEVTNTTQYSKHIQSYNSIIQEEVITTSTVDIGGGVIRTDTLSTITDSIVLDKTVELSDKETSKYAYGPTSIYIYEHSAGNTVLDGIIGSAESNGQFFPVIPIYVDNKFISDTYLPDIYKKTKSAYRRVTGNQQLSKVIKKLKESESLPDIDYAYCAFGVSLNVVDMACKEYLYNFFEYMDEQHSWKSNSLDQYLIEVAEANNSYIAYNAWLLAQSELVSTDKGTPPPVLKEFPKVPSTKIRNYSSNPILGYDQTISWLGVKKETFTGLGKPGAKVKDYWIQQGTEFSLSEWGVTISGGGEGGSTSEGPTSRNVDTIWIFHQKEANQYDRLSVLDLKHRNVVYKGHYTEITAKQALLDPKESAFIIPLHGVVYDNMRMVSRTQMTTAASFLLLNSYVVTKVKWYQTGFFRLVLIVAAIVLAVYTGGQSLGATQGILGTNAMVGATIGIESAVAAAIAGAAINAVAAMIVFNVIMKAASSVFGPEIGAIIAVVATMLLQDPSMLTSFGSSFTDGLTNLMSASNILKLTNAVGQGMQAVAGIKLGEAQEVVQEYAAKTLALKTQFINEFGMGDNFNASDYITKQSSSPSIVIESLDVFLTRTLLSGSDVVNLTHTLLSEFTSLTTSVDSFKS